MSWQTTLVMAASHHHPGIAKQFNLHGGTAQFWKQIDQGMDFPDPPGGFPGMYLTRADTEALIAAIANDPEDENGSGFFHYMVSKDPVYLDLWRAFHDATNAKANEITQSNDLFSHNSYQRIREFWINSLHLVAILDGGFAVSVDGCYAQAMLSLNQVRPFLTSTQGRQLKAVLSMIGHILWDNDFVPIDNWQGFTLGTANMPVQYNQARYQIACLLKDHPQFSARFARVLDEVVDSFTNATSQYGAPKDSPHYAGALVLPILDVFRQLQLGGYIDVFAPSSNIYNRLTGLAEWTMQVMSPPQARFGGLRKMVCYGDGTSEGTDLMLALIMGFESHNLTLSKRMAGAWADMGQPMSSFYASSGLKIRPDFPTQDPALGDADFPGYMTVMRSGWGTANESAVFLSHGDSLTDHSTFQRGSPSLYLLGAPVCISYGSMGSPHVVGPWVSCSTYIPVSEIGFGVSQLWSGTPLLTSILRVAGIRTSSMTLTLMSRPPTGSTSPAPSRCPAGSGT